MWDDGSVLSHARWIDFKGSIVFILSLTRIQVCDEWIKVMEIIYLAYGLLTLKSKWMKLCLCQSSKYSTSCLMICAMSSSVVECMFHTLSNRVLPSTLQVEKIVWIFYDAYFHICQNIRDLRLFKLIWDLLEIFQRHKQEIYIDWSITDWFKF